MLKDYFLGFACHAHTKNEIFLDPNSDLELRTSNSPEEAQIIIEKVLDKLEKDISNSGYFLKNVRLLILYLSYRGENEEKDRLICERILKIIGDRFKGKDKDSYQVRLIGHTTSGEIENEDILLNEITGIGYNGLSLLALVSNLPIGIGRTWGINSETGAVEQGKEMVHNAWIDFNQETQSKDHIQKSKTLCVLEKFGVLENWQNHFLAEGIASFMGNTREARITNVMGGIGADGTYVRMVRQFYGKIGTKSELKILQGESVCALIPNLSEPSIGVDTNPMQRIGTSHSFKFDPEIKPHFMYVKRIDNKDPREVYGKTIFDTEKRISSERGLPILDKGGLIKIISEFEPIAFHPIFSKYALAFPFANYAPIVPDYFEGQIVQLERPVRSFEPKMDGYIVQLDYKRVQKGARNVHNMLRDYRGFVKNDVTLIFSCILRRISEILADQTINSESNILKEAFSSTQLFGFIGYGELSFTHLLQEPYTWNFSCWGITLRSETNGRLELKPDKLIAKVLPNRIKTGFKELDYLLLGGIPEKYAVVLTGSPSDERQSIIHTFLGTGINEDQISLYITTEAEGLENILENNNFYLFLCNPKPKTQVQDLPNVYKLRSKTDLTNLSISLAKVYRNIDPSKKKRICVEIVSDVLMDYETKATRKWISELITDLGSKGFTILAIMNPTMHPVDQVNAILDVFDGEISILQSDDQLECKKSILVKKLRNQDYVKNPICLK